MSNKYMDWRLWAHYVVLTTIVVYFLHAYTTVRLLSGSVLALFAIISLGDIAIHITFGKLLNWKD